MPERPFESYLNLEAVPARFGPTAVTIGNFDGVHRGHQAILRRTLDRARADDWKAVAVLFDPHPLRIVAPERAPKLLSTPDERIERIGELGLDAAVVLRFTRELMRLSPEQFVREVLVERLGVRHVVVGGNFRFGHRHEGDVDTLERLGQTFGFGLDAVDGVRFRGKVVSSSAVRQALEAGRSAEARRLLGRAPSVRGRVVAGRGIGSKQTVPTLNLAPDSDIEPASGVYVTRTRELSGDRCWRSVTNVGVRPTFGGGDKIIETHLLDPLEGVSPERVEVAFFSRLRSEMKFETAEALRRQILVDAGRAQKFFAKLAVFERRTV